MIEQTEAMPKAYSYLRFSTPEQQRGHSFRRQKDMAAAYASRHGLDLEEVSFQDLGISAFRGRNRENGALGEFLDAVRDGVIDRGAYLLVESLDRLSREKPRKAARVLEDICETGITLVTLTDGKSYTSEDFDRDPMAFMWAYMVAIRSNEESEIKSARLKAAWEHKRQKAGNQRLTTKCPHWMRASEDGFELIAERAAVVRMIFDMAAQGIGQNAITDQLNRDRIPTFGTSAYWNRSYVVKVLRNPATVGTYVPHRIEYVNGKRTRIPADPVTDYYPAAVNHQLFNEVQALGTGTVSPKRGRHTKVQNILGGIARCPKCDGTMTRVSKGSSKGAGKPYLVCARAKQGAGCTYKTVPYEPIEATVLGSIERLWEETPRPGEAGELRGMLMEVEAGLDAAIDEEAALYRAVANNATERDRLKLRKLQVAIQKEEERRREIVERIAAINRTSPDAALERLERLCEANPEKIDRGAINVELRRILSAAVIDYEGHFERITFRFASGKTVPSIPYAVKPA